MKMVESNKSMIQVLLHSSHHVASSAEELQAHTKTTVDNLKQIIDSFQTVANGTDIQLQSVEESNRAMEEIAIGIQRIAESSVAVTENSFLTVEESQTGQELLENAIRQINKIHDSVTNTALHLEQLDKRSVEISKILDIITEISAQTNLLALNAAIEAARAGDNGRGFAVVADEARKLAEQSTESTHQISNLITQIQEEAKLSTSSMHKGVKDVEEGIASINQVGISLQRILKSAQGVAEQIEGVSAISEEMAASTEEVIASVNEVAHMAREVSSTTKTVASSSTDQLHAMEDVRESITSLTDRAEELQKLVERFKI